MNPKWGSFTSAIFAQDESTDMRDAYQRFGRITGRMKSKIWKKYGKYCQTTVYCSTSFMNKCIHTEECTRSLSQEKIGESATENDYDNPPNSTLDDEQLKRSNKRIKKSRKKSKSNENKLSEINQMYGLTELYDNPKRVKRHIINTKLINKSHGVTIYDMNKDTNTIKMRRKVVPINTYESDSQFILNDVRSGMSNLDTSPDKKKTVCRIMPVKDTSGNLKWIGIYLKKAMKMN